MEKILVPALVSAFAFGWKFYAKASAESAASEKLAASCGIDSSCRMAVEKFLGPCFDDYGVDPPKLVDCINHRAGQRFFAYDQGPD